MYRYKMMHRPFSIGCQPIGQIEYVERNKQTDGCYGILTYTRPLSDSEVSQYELWEIQEKCKLNKLR